MRNNLINARKNKNATAKNLADFLKMTTRAYQYIEKGERDTVGANWLKLFEYFDGKVQLHELMKNS